MSTEYLFFGIVSDSREVVETHSTESVQVDKKGNVDASCSLFSCDILYSAFQSTVFRSFPR